MSIASESIHGRRTAPLALRYALRELRSGLRGFYVFIACIALGVMAIAGVGSVAASLRDGLAREGRNLLGRHRVIDPSHLLLDDRTLVEFAGDVVSGRSDELHAVLVSLMVGPGALEAGEH